MTSDQVSALLRDRAEQTRSTIRSSRETITRSSERIRTTYDLVARCRNEFALSVRTGDNAIATGVDPRRSPTG